MFGSSRPAAAGDGAGPCPASATERPRADCAPPGTRIPLAGVRGRPAFALRSC
jgi:hypothetical protein